MVDMSNAEYTLYSWPFSLYSMMVRHTIQLGPTTRNATPPRKISLGFVKHHMDENLEEDYLLRVNPKGQVPAMTGNVVEQPLTESRLISLYLAEKHYPAMLPVEHADAIRNLLDRIHSVYGLSFSNKNPTAEMVQHNPSSAEDMLKRTDLSPKYREALEAQVRYHNQHDGVAFQPAVIAKAHADLHAIFAEITEHRRHSGASDVEAEWIFGSRIGPTVLDSHLLPLILRCIDSDNAELVPPELRNWARAMAKGAAWQKVMHGRPTHWNPSLGPTADMPEIMSLKPASLTDSRTSFKSKMDFSGSAAQRERAGIIMTPVRSPAMEESSRPESHTSAGAVRDAFDDEETAANAEQTDSRRMESSKTKLFVLIGSGILQLPIWGFAMSYGVFQEYYSDNMTFTGDGNITGIIGTTANGVMYLSMPFLFALFTRRWAHRRQIAALCGTVIACVSFFLSSYSTAVWHLVVTQGIASALGCALIYSPTTLSLGEWYTTSNRTVAYGIVLSCKNIVGTSCPFMLRALIDIYGFRTTLKVWTAIVGGTSIFAIFMIPTHPSKVSIQKNTRGHKIPWHFLRHQSIYFYSTAIIFQSSGYGIPQTYLSTYARDVALLSQTSGTLMLALFNASGIIASSFFGWLSDNKRITLSAQVVSTIPPVCCAVSTFLFWGLTSQGSIGLLIVFSMTFGFFSSGYSATWGGMLKQMESESAERNEAVDPGMLFMFIVSSKGYPGEYPKGAFYKSEHSCKNDESNFNARFQNPKKSPGNDNQDQPRYHELQYSVVYLEGYNNYPIPQVI
ncbi:hypothetical protein AK830_g12280 [Neonectria ditissima]|uniref:GST N-terminal domain-containing protein n=1 Tax=Neonectria ditissima TaxID=78410 RepID=A0A0P7AZF0_9HYPO|nr:hypothetical protein AK830_g12280 [Neonectria ditissima]